MIQGKVATGIYHYLYDGEDLVIAERVRDLSKRDVYASPIVDYKPHDYFHLTFFQMSVGTDDWYLYLADRAIDVVDRVIDRLPKDTFKHSPIWFKAHPEGTYYKVWVPKETNRVAVENALQRSGIKGRVR